MAAVKSCLAAAMAVLNLIMMASGNAGAVEPARQWQRTPEDEARLRSVIAFADNVLDLGRDRWSGRDTPLLADGINVDTRQPVVWRHEGEEYIIHNLASQQNLFRTLTALTRITGESRYEQAAKAAIRFHFDHIVSPCGKLRWGGHQFIDLRTLEPIGHFDVNCHEFKRNYPYYEIMWEVDQTATVNFLRALWAGHVVDWRTLAMNRHARYTGGPPPGPDMWDRPFDDPDPFFYSPGLSFLNCGSDLIFAGAMLYRLNAEQGALDWALRLAGMYVKARHPRTGMGAYQFTKPERRREPPAEGRLPTGSVYGDRMENQFGRSGSSDPADEYYNPIKDKMADDGMLVAREGWAWRNNRGGYAWHAIVLLELAESLGDRGTAFLDDAASHLEAHALHGYDPANNRFPAMWADGTDVTGLRIPRTGYHGRKGERCLPLDANMVHLLAYVRAFRLSRRPALWETARHMARGLGLGEIGEQPDVAPRLAAEVVSPGPGEIFVLLELNRTAPHPEYIQRARHVADRLVEERFHGGFFLPSADHINANFDALDPLALLALDAALRGRPEHVPAWVGSQGYIHGRFDGHGRTYAHRAIWAARRSADGAKD